MKKLALLTLLLASNAYAESIAQLGWMTGAWQHKDTEEHWIAPKGGSMLAVNRTTKGERTVEFEFLRIIERDGKVIYIASPMGRPPTEFAATSVEAKKVVFENPAHGFPAKIIYSAESPDVLLARIEGQGRSMEWRFARMK